MSTPSSHACACQSVGETTVQHGPDAQVAEVEPSDTANAARLFELLKGLEQHEDMLRPLITSNLAKHKDKVRQSIECRADSLCAAYTYCRSKRQLP